MAITRHYSLIAKEGSGDELGRALCELAANVRGVSGCEGVELYQDMDAPLHFILIERWQSIDVHKASGRLLGKEIFGRVMTALSAPPLAAYLESRMLS